MLVFQILKFKRILHTSKFQNIVNLAFNEVTYDILMLNNSLFLRKCINDN